MDKYTVELTVDEKGLRGLVENEIDPIEEIIFWEMQLLEGNGIYIGEIKKVDEREVDRGTNADVAGGS